MVNRLPLGIRQLYTASVDALSMAEESGEREMEDDARVL